MQATVSTVAVVLVVTAGFLRAAAERVARSFLNHPLHYFVFWLRRRELGSWFVLSGHMAHSSGCITMLRQKRICLADCNFHAKDIWRMLGV